MEGPGTTGYFMSLLGVVTLVLLALAAVLFIVDPQGLTQGNAICSAGAKSKWVRPYKSIIAYREKPRAVILGSSRAEFGFDSGALSLLGQGPVLNLGVSGATIHDHAGLVADAKAGGRLEKAYIGLSLGLVGTERQPPPIQPISNALWPRAAYVMRGFANNEALRTLTQLGQGCRPLFAPDGAVTGQPFIQQIDGITRIRALRSIPASWRRIALTLERGDRNEITQSYQPTRQLLTELREHGVETIVYSEPLTQAIRASHGKAGLEEEFHRWTAETKAITENAGARFIDFNTPEIKAAMGLPFCPHGSIDCHFIDLTHYSPVIGRAMARELAKMSSQRE
ncbi:MAG: hypothetical protein P8J20_14895 [Novosphingobium sp.]|nr:hypothetical protein [Novosphingobium sp.]